MSDHFGIDNSFHPKDTVQSEEIQIYSKYWSSFPRQAGNQCM